MAESNLIKFVQKQTKKLKKLFGTRLKMPLNKNMENRLEHEKDIIIGQVLNRIDIMMKEEWFGQGAEITVVLKDERGADNGT